MSDYCQLEAAKVLFKTLKVKAILDGAKVQSEAYDLEVKAILDNAKAQSETNEVEHNEKLEKYENLRKYLFTDKQNELVDEFTTKYGKCPFPKINMSDYGQEKVNECATYLSDFVGWNLPLNLDELQICHIDKYFELLDDARNKLNTIKLALKYRKKQLDPSYIPTALS